MSGPALIINTHPEENPEFVNPLEKAAEELQIDYRSVEGYQTPEPSFLAASCIFLTGVPCGAEYSLSEPDTGDRIDSHFRWLKNYRRPLLGICYGHQIIAHLLGGTITSLEEPVHDPRLEIRLSGAPGTGLFQGYYRLKVFAEHRDYVSRVPGDSRVLARRRKIPYLIRYTGREWYGCQFVPERSDTNTQQLLKRFLLSSAGSQGGI